MPFEEDERDPSIWFLDHSYVENMWSMSKKINGAEPPRSTLPACGRVSPLCGPSVRQGMHETIFQLK